MAHTHMVYQICWSLSSFSLLAFKSSDTEPWLEVKYNDAPWKGAQPVAIIKIEDEIDFLISNLEFILDPENVRINIFQFE